MRCTAADRILVASWPAWPTATVPPPPPRPRSVVDRRPTRLRAVILALAQHRGPNSSICPSDAARAVGGYD